MCGGGVAEPDVLPHIAGRQRDVAVSVLVGHGDRAVTVDGGDGPGVAVADRLTCAGDEPPVVAAGGDDVTDVDRLAGGYPCGDIGVEVAGFEACGLDGVVDGVDVVVRRRDDGDAAAAVVVVDPGGGHTGEVIVEGAGNDPAVRFVGVERGGVTAS